MERLEKLITETKEWHRYHKSSGRLGAIEALAATIRLRALEDAKTAVGGTTHDQ